MDETAQHTPPPSPDWGTAMAVWWSFTWRTFLYVAAVNFVLGLVYGAGAPGLSSRPGAWLGLVAVLAVDLALAVLAMKQALSRHLSTLAALARPGANL